MDANTPEVEHHSEEYSSNEDYIRACSDAITALGEMDLSLMGPGYAERAIIIKERIFDILEHCINEIYEDTILLEKGAGEPEF